jgi:steroid 5-alpha reductase family enzyme
MSPDMLQLMAASAVLVFGSFIALWIIGLFMKDSSLVDIWFAPCIALAAVLGYYIGGGAASRRTLLAVLAIVWAARLGGYLLWRNWGREDPRYARFRKTLEDQGRNFAWHSLTRINLYQGLIVFMALAPFIVAQTAPEPQALGLLAFAGTAIWFVGVFFQGVADWQLARFKADAGNAGKVLDTGLWRYSRHPNYFGEACVWWGYWLIACEVPWGFVTVFAPAFLTWSILGMMGKQLVERRMLKKRPGYQDYVARTSGFFPWPPRRPASPRS